MVLLSGSIVLIVTSTSLCDSCYRASIQWLFWVLWTWLQAAHQPLQHDQPEHTGVHGQDQVCVNVFLICLYTTDLVHGASYLLNRIWSASSNSRILLSVGLCAFRQRLFENLRMLPHAPGVQMQAIPEDAVPEDTVDEDTEDPDKRLSSKATFKETNLDKSPKNLLYRTQKCFCA